MRRSTAAKLLRAIPQLAAGRKVAQLSRTLRLRKERIVWLKKTIALRGVGRVRRYLLWQGGDNSVEMARYYRWESGERQVCPQCGYRVRLPCVACRATRRLERRHLP